MLRFFFRKTFYDTWDSMFALAGLNAAALAAAGLSLWLASGFGPGLPRVAGLALFVVLSSLWSSAAAFALADTAAAGRQPSWAAVRAALGPSVAPGLQAAAMVGALVLVDALVLPFYLSRGGLLGTFAAGLVFWFSATIALALQYFLPLRASRRRGFVDALRLSFYLFADAPFFSVILAAYGLACLALCPLVAFLLPGAACATLAASEAARLRLRKLDWIAASGGKPAGRTPWGELLADDMEGYDGRTLKDLIFPWKK